MWQGQVEIVNRKSGCDRIVFPTCVKIRFSSGESIIDVNDGNKRTRFRMLINNQTNDFL